MAKLTLEGDVYEIEILAEKCLRRKEDKADVGGMPPGNLMRTPEDGGVYAPEVGAEAGFGFAPVMPMPPDIAAAAARNAEAYGRLQDEMWPHPRGGGLPMTPERAREIAGIPPLHPGIGRPGGPPFRPMPTRAQGDGYPHGIPEPARTFGACPPSNPLGREALSLDDARGLFDGLYERLRAIERRQEVLENVVGIQHPNDAGPDDPFDDSDETPARGEMPPPPPVPTPRNEVLLAREAKVREGKREAAAAAGDLDGAAALPDAGEEGLALLDALRQAKELLGPSAIVVRSGDTYVVQDSAEPAKVVGTGPSWDAALKDAMLAVAELGATSVPPILPDQDLPAEKALAHARATIDPDVLLSFSPADSSRTRVCLSRPIGTPGRKMILAGSFLEAIAEYRGVTVEQVRDETGHYTPEEASRRLLEKQRQDCQTPGVCCTPPAPEEFRSPAEAAGLDDDEEERKRLSTLGGLTDGELDAAV